MLRTFAGFNSISQPVALTIAKVGLGPPVAGDGGTVQVDDDMTGHRQRFYRLVVF